LPTSGRADTFSFFGVGANVVVDGSQFPWGFERGEGSGWAPARVRRVFRPLWWGCGRYVELMVITAAEPLTPTRPGFATVEIRPRLGSLAYARGTLVHPRSEIAVDVYMGEDGLHGQVSLPPGVRAGCTSASASMQSRRAATRFN
jgi:hypothetical protein